ncbi:unnamed protein product [Sphagnum jensenii]|uniref:CBS domain-containing protein n=1 Tax=Sphagnum jensenii TaxID=128206 RepID=A0ABP1A718_9BRYO
MDGFFHSRQVGDLALGKPAVRRLPITATVGEALKFLKKTHGPHLGLWVQQQSQSTTVRNNVHREQENFLVDPNPGSWQCVGRVSMIEIICFLARDESLLDLAAALKAPLSVFVSPTSSAAIHHVDSRTKLFEALESFLDGVQHLVVPIEGSISNSVPHSSSSIPNTKLGAAWNINMQLPQSTHGLRHFCISMSQNVLKPECETQEYCWLVPEDVVRFLLSCIGLFSPIPMMSIQQLGLINTEVLVTRAAANAMSAVPLIQQAAREMTAVAVVEDDDENPGELKLVGDISAFTMKGCNETAALALATLSVQDFLSYAQDCGGPPSSLVELVQSRVREKVGTTKLSSQLTTPMNSTSIDDHQHFSSVSKGLAPFLLAGHHGLDTGSEESSDEDQPAKSPDGPLALSFNSITRQSFSRGRMAPNTCRPWSSLVAVMAQALTHRVGYIWVMDDASSLLGIVTYLDIIDCLLNNLYESSQS